MGTLVAKIKSAPILMATISITFLGAVISFIINLVMAEWALGYLEMRVPFDVEIRNNYSHSLISEANISNANELPALDYSEVVDYLNEKGYDVNDYCEVKKYFINEEEYYNVDQKNISLIGIRLSDFNKMRRMLGYEEISLKDNEFTTQWYSVVTDEEINSFLKANSTLNINDITLKISKNSTFKESIGEGIYGAYVDNIIILPDKVCDELPFIESNFLANINNKMSYEEANDFQNNYVYQWFRKNNEDFVEEYSKDDDVSYSVLSTRIQLSERNNILNVTLAMRILGIYLGVVLLMISLTILSLSQLTDSIEHKDRFKVIKRLGVEAYEINKIILKQISVYFIIPIAIAMIGVVTFIYNYYIVYKNIINTYIGNEVFILTIILGVILMIGIYLCYFVGTYYSFKRNINN